MALEVQSDITSPEVFSIYTRAKTACLFTLAAALFLKDTSQSVRPTSTTAIDPAACCMHVGSSQQRVKSAPAGRSAGQQQQHQAGQEVPAQVRCFAAHYAGDEGLARPFSAAPSDRNLAWGEPPCQFGAAARPSPPASA